MRSGWPESSVPRPVKRLPTSSSRSNPRRRYCPRSWTRPALVFGVNPILAYVGSELMASVIGGGITMPWGHRIAILRDPEGRTVYLAEDKTR